MSAATDTDAATIEPLLEQLIRQHGLALVEEHLAILFGPGVSWPAYQRVANLARHVARRIEAA